VDLKYPGLLLAGLVVGCLVAALGWWQRDRGRRPRSLPLANTDLLTGLPEFSRALARHRLRTATLAVATSGVAILALVGAARPFGTAVITPDQTNRDIVLCLDVSGSMTDVDEAVLATFRRLADGFRGERLSLVVFNTSAVPVFPLTDDAQFLQDQLLAAQQAFTHGLDGRFFAGTLLGSGSSLIGDGVATCVHSFDHAEAHRARSIILATDNLPAGRSIFPLVEAAALARAADIQIYAMNPADRAGSSAADELKAASEATGGRYFGLGATDTVARILASVGEREAQRIPGGAQLLRYDTPAGVVVLVMLGVPAVFLARRWWSA